MPTINAFYDTNQTFVRNRLAGVQPDADSMELLSPEERAQATKKLFDATYQENRSDNWAQTLAKTAATTYINMHDDLYGNVLIPGTEKGDVWDFVKNYGGTRGRQMESHYRNHSDAINTISGVTGAIGTAYLTSALILPKLAGALASSTAISRSPLWMSGQAMNASVRSGMLNAQMEAAVSAESFFALRTLAGAKRSWAGAKYLGLESVKMAGVALAEEAAIVATMNANEAIWADDLSTNLLFAGLGIGAGGTLGAVAARAEMRRIANSPSMVQLRATALDAQGFMRMREHYPDVAHMRALATPDMRPKESATFTAHLLTARQETAKGTKPALQSKYERLQTQATEQAKVSLQKISIRGAPGVSGTKFRADSGGGLHIMEAAHGDPLLLHGADSLATTERTERTIITAQAPKVVETGDPVIDRARKAFAKDSNAVKDIRGILRKAKGSMSAGDFARFRAEAQRLQSQAQTSAQIKNRNTAYSNPAGAILLAREDYISTLRGTGQASDVREADRLAKQQPLILYDNHWFDATHQDAKGLSGFTPAKVKVKQVQKGIPEFLFETSTKKQLRIADNMKIHFGKKQVDFAKLRAVERAEVLSAQHQMFSHMKRLKLTYTLPDKPTWFQIDSALEFKRRGGTIDMASKAGFKSEDEMLLASLALKADATAGMNIGDHWIRQAYNLPRPNSLERIYDSNGDMIRAVLDAAKNGGTKADIEALYKQLKATNGFDVKEAPVEFNGNMYNFNKTEKGEWKTPVIGFFDNDSIMQKTVSYSLAEQLAEQKAAKILSLVSKPDASLLTPILTMELLASPEFQKAVKLLGLSDEQITGSGTTTKQLLGEFLTREFRYRDNETLLALARLREAVNKASDAHLTKLLQNHLGDVIPRLNAAPAGSSKVLVNQFASNSPGWDLKEVPLDLGDGHHGFILEKTKANADRLGRDVLDDELLVNPRTGKNIVVDDLGLEFLDRFASITRTILKDTNRIRAAHGLEPIKSRPWYVPPRDTRHKYVAFTLDANNRTVPGGTIIAKTRLELDQLRREHEANLPAGHKVLTREDIEAHIDLYDQAQIGWVDPGELASPKSIQKGTLTTDTINPESVQEMLSWIQQQVERIGTGTIRTLFDSQLNIARMRGGVERASRSITGSPIRTIWDEYEQTLLGRALGNQQTSLSGSIMKPIESFINGRLEAAWPALRAIGPNQMTHWIGDLAHKMGVKNLKAIKTFDALAAQLGPYTPYKNAVDFATQTLKVSQPPEIREMARGMNTLSSFLILRAMEIGHPAMNMLGIITTMPSILSAGRAPVSLYAGQAGRKLRVVDAGRILIDSMHDLTRKTSHADWDYMVKHGYTTQPVAELHKQLSMVTDRSSFYQIFRGDDSIPTPRHGIDNFKSVKAIRDMSKRKGLEGMLSAATDTSESWSRTWAHFAGLRLADLQGITGQTARHNFAAEIANAAIANYSPTNRPEIYQSAFGSMAGLFMSWMQSYNQRLFRWMEDKEYGLIGQQLGMQSALFGVASMPAYNYLEKFLLASGVGDTVDGREATIVDHIYARFGPTLGSAIVHGGLNQANIVLYTRGDMNYRDMTLDPTRLAAGLGVGKSVVSAISEVTESMLSKYSVEDSQRLAEIMSRNMPNRVMQGWISVLANEGKDIDTRGAIKSETKSFFESAVRMLGLRSSRQQAEIEAFYANRQSQDREAARMDVLRRETRSLLRTDTKNIDSQLLNVFNKYLDAGGRPDHFKQWITDNLRNATTTRGMNDIRRSLSDPDNMLRIWRYNAYGAM